MINDPRFSVPHEYSWELASIVDGGMFSSERHGKISS